MTVTQEGDVYYINLLEIVTMRGEPITTSPEEYPLIRAAKWALTQVDNANVRETLNQYIQSMTIGVNESVKEGIEIVFVVSHDIEIKSGKGQLQIVKDNFTDKATDNDIGFDNVTWSIGGFMRVKPDWNSMIDYEIYRMPVETLGKILLKDSQPSADKPIEQLATVTYFRWNARSYIVYYTSNTALKPQECGGTIRRDTTYWNSSYAYVWNVDATIRCNDCADYVSQALRNGAIPTDSTWYPNRYNGPWTNVNALRDYLNNTYFGVYLISKTSLQVGELVIIPSTHVAMTTQVNPHLVSGHTNDRNNYPLSTSYTQFLHIDDHP